MYPKVMLSHPIFFGDRVHCNFGNIVVVLSVASTVLILLNNHLLQRPKTNLRNIMGQDHLIYLELLCIERAYVNRVDFQPILDQKTLVIYFGSCNKSELMNSMLAKGYHILSY